uniref:putative Ig domain-containing protein n=1 Tax=Methanolobus psychrotolerans TaxID=1874706 RepID=UPI00101AE36B
MFLMETEKCKKMRFLLTCIVLLMLVSSVIASAHSNESVTMGSIVVNPDTSFSLPIFIGNVSNLQSLSLDIAFEGHSIFIDDIVANTELPGSKMTYYIDNSTGFANMTLGSVNITTEEPIPVADVFFRAITSGYYNIMLRDVSLGNDAISYPAQFVFNGSVRVNHPPHINSISDKTVNIGYELSFSVYANDADDYVLFYDVEDLPEGYDINYTTGLFKWTPTTFDGGTHNANFSVSDGFAVNFTHVNIIVNETIADLHPEFHPIGNKSVNENEFLSFTIKANGPNGVTVVYSALYLPGNSSLDASTGEFTWTPDYNDSGVHVVDFIASSNGLTDSETITITVNNVDRAPILDPIGNKEVDETELLSFTISATDPDIDDVTYSANDLPVGASLDATTGEFTWTPDYNDSGVHVVDFIASSNGLTDSETITITVNNVDRAPILDPIGNKEVDETELLSFTISATDSDIDDVTYSANDLPVGASLDASTGEFTWTPDYNDSGVHVVDFIASSNGLTDSETITITVNNVDRAPILDPVGNKEV